MVEVKRIQRKPKPQEEPTDPAMYDLIEIYIQDPTDKPDPAFMVHARPYEFADNKPTKFSTTSPHCGDGIFFEINEIREKYGHKFLGCPHTGIGVPKETEPFDNPFVNPIVEGKLTESELDADLVSPVDIGLSDKTVAEKMKDG